MPVQGSLRDLNVLDLLQLISAQRKSVTLRLESGSEVVESHFQEGLLTACHRRGVGANEPFLDTLVGLGHISPSEALEVTSQVQDHGRDLWTVVRELPHLQRGTCEEVYRQATEATLDRILLWGKGRFSMLPLAPIEAPFRPGLSVDVLLVDAMRRLDELAAWKQGSLPAASVPCLAKVEEHLVSSDPLRRAVLRQIDGRRTVGQIAEAARLGEYEVYQTIAGGIEAGWIQILGTVEIPPPAPPAKSEVLQRAPALAALLILLVLGVGSSWIGVRFGAGSTAWIEARTRWEEVDLRRMIEVYRYRHGSYPSDLTALIDEGLPLPKDAPERWGYRLDADAYRLQPIGQ